jgi:hypothetical protein
MRSKRVIVQSNGKGIKRQSGGASLQYDLLVLFTLADWNQ